MEAQHDHLPKEPCLPTCPGWAESALSLLAFQRRYAEMLEACRTAAIIERVDVVPQTQGVVLPEYLKDEEVVRLNMVVGRDTPEVLLDEWGIRCNLTFRRQRHECALPWTSVLGGLLRPPPRKRLRFGVIAGTDQVPPPDEAAAGGAGGEAPESRPPPDAEPPRPSGPRRFGVIEGGKSRKD